MNNRFADQFMLVCFSIQKDSTLRKKDAVLGRFRLFQCHSWLVFMSKIGAGLVHLVHKPASNLPNPLSPSPSSVDGLHRGEEEYVADGVGVGEQHDQAIHAEAKAAGRGQDGPLGSIRGRNLLCRRDFQVSLERCGCSSLPVFTLLAEGDGAGNRSRQKPRKA